MPKKRSIAKLKCPECGKVMKLLNSRYGKFYGCTGWPNCKCKHGAHPDGSPKGVPGNKEVRALRIEVHKICGEIWGEWDSKYCDKKAMYAWLKNNAPKGHIAHMLKDDLLETKKLLMVHYIGCIGVAVIQKASIGIENMKR